MKYIAGQIIKPDRSRADGTVIFTNGVDDCLPNEQSCVAYGYTWDRYSNTCRAFKPADLMLVMKDTLLVGNSVGGVRNETEEGSFYNTINGVDNTIKKGVQNSIVTGRGNVIENDLSNVSISGTYGKALRQGEIVLGGGNYNSGTYNCGYAQSSTIHCTSRTSGSGTFIAGVGGNNSAKIAVQSHSVIIVKLTGICVKEQGGTYWGFNSKWFIQMANDNQATFCIASSATECGTAPEEWIMPAFLQLTAGEEFKELQLNVTGLPEVDLMYNIKLEITETRNLTNY
jgi:hypothetical protein|tara:strand:+ start:22708 stop:23562 length:855 start_codon:yes stop_codon:yes gene_type:complete